MKTVTYGPNTLVLYDSIENLPPHRESQMFYYLLSEVGIGHSFEAIQDHMHGVRMAAANGDQVALNQELENMAFTYLSMAGQYNPKYIAWLCLVHKINGEELVDISEDNLMEVGKKLSEEGGIAYMWEEVFDELKKKFPASWRLTFLGEEEMDLEKLSMLTADIIRQESTIS